jgi:hypothetical protein
MKKEKTFQCLGCCKNLSTKQRLTTHEKTCKLLKEAIEKEKEENYFLVLLREKDQKIKELEDKLNAFEKMTSRDIASIDVITDSLFENLEDKLKLEDVANGPEYLAHFAVKNVFQNRIVCTDYSRQIIRYKREDGKMIVEPALPNLGKKFFQSVSNKATILLNNEISKLNSKGDEDEEDESTSLLCTELLFHKIRIQKSALGNMPKYFKDFVKHVCRLTIMS